jgi:tetratricopeptide (TPR) repeat protein
MAESLLYSNRDSAELLLRQVERPERLDEAHLAQYWFVTCDLHANSMQSLSEDSMICWASGYYRRQWEQEHGDARAMMLTGLEEAMYYWWNGNKQQAQAVMQRQKEYADEVAELTGDHLWQVVVLRVSGELAMRDYDYERVRACTETLIGLDDGKAIHLDEVERVYNALAIVYFSLGEYDKMERAFEEAIANAADSTFIVNVVRRNYADLLGTEFLMDKKERIMTFASGSSHAMTLMAVDLDATGKPVKWMVENSWGEDYGYNGHIIMTDSWFDEYVFRLVVNKKYIPQNILDMSKQKPTMLPAWDPMFTPEK